jgi:dipeptidyl aminopeptidase/acylaminoacyl peptidase
LQSTNAATVTLAGTTTAAGLYPFQLSVTDGAAKQTIDLSLGVTHRVAFLADRSGGTLPDLWLANVGKEVPGSPVRVNEFLYGRTLTSFQWSPDGGYIAYTLRNSSSEELYVTAVTNPGTATLVESAATASATGYVWLNSGQTLAVATTRGTLDLVDVAGATLIKQTAPLPAVASGEQRGIGGLVASPVGRALGIVYSDWANDGHGAWRTVVASYYIDWPEGGSVTAAKLFAINDSSSDDILPTTFSSDGTLAIVQPGFYLMTYDLTNPAVPVGVTGSAGGLNPYWSPTGRDLMTTAPQSGIYFARVASGAWSASQVVPGANTLFVEWSPNGNHILLTVDHDLRTLANVAAASPSSDVSLLPDGFLINGFTSTSRARWSPDSTWVAFGANQTTSAIYEMYLVRWPGPGSLNPVSAMTAAPGVGVWQFSPNSNALAYVGTTYSATTSSLHLVTLPATGAAPNAVALTGASDPTVRDDITWLPGSRVLLYRAADAGGDQVHGVHISANGIASAPFSVSGATTTGKGVTAYAVAP